MLEIRKFELKQAYDSLILQWEIDATQAYDFTIKRSENPEKFNGTNLVVGTQLTDAGQYKDEETRYDQPDRTWYYLLTVMEQNETKSQTVSIQPGNMTIVRAILDKQSRALRDEFGGREIKVFIRKTVGPKCSKCWDDLRKRRTISNCTVCYETGIAGGYYAPITTRASKFPVPMIEEIGKFGILTQNLPVMWISNYPDLKSGQNDGDVIYDMLEKKHYKIIRVEKSELHAVVTQKMTLKQLLPENIECSLGTGG